MAATSPSPSSPSLTVPPAPNSTSTTQPPQASSPPPTPLTSSPSSQPNANSPETTNSTSNSPPPQSSPPPTAPLSPPPQPPVVSPPPLVPPTAPPSNPQSPPPTSPPPSPTSSGAPPPSTSGSSLPPETSPPPPPPSSTPPISSGAPPPSTSGSSPPPETSPPPPSSTPPVNSPPPPSSNPPANSPPSPSSKPPKNSPPSPSAQPPQTSPPPPSPISPESPPSPPASSPPPSSSPTPPPPKSVPPTSSPPPAPTLISPERSPPPASIPPKNAPAPPRLSPPAPSGSNSTPAPEKSRPSPSPSPPSPIIRLSPPPSSPVSPQPPSGVPNSPSDNGTSNGTSPNVPGSANTGGGISTGGVVAIGVIAGIIVLSLIALAVWCLRKRRKKVSGLGGHVMPSPLGSSPESAFFKAHSSAPLIGSRPSSDFVDTPTEPGGLGHSRSWFTFEELSQATNGFSDQNLLGEGGFGPVYRGYLPDGREIAVKQLKVGGGQGEREFKAEVEIISRIHHRHLVSLVGYCISENRRLLVYDYVPNNTLYYHLQAEGQPVLEWAIRVKIAAGAARGIAYLHEDCQPRIIHRDIKSSNILLDNNFEARVSDFGLAKLALDADTHISTRVIGTFGYLAPEYASSGKLTEKSDVYSFGVVLLELITGRKPVDPSRPLGEESLVEWARPLLGHVLESGELDGLVDPRLNRNFMESEMLRMIEIAATCVRHSSAKRPRMGQVVRAFDSLAAADITNGMRVGESEMFNSAQQSEEIRWFRRMAFGSQDYSTDFFSQDSLRSSRETTVHIE